MRNEGTAANEATCFRASPLWGGVARALLACVALAIAPATWAADVDELFEESMSKGKIDISLLGAGQLDDTRCWGHAPKSGELVCVVFAKKGDAATWSVVVFSPQRGEVERHVVATRADDYAAPVKGRGVAAANAALKKRKWAPKDMVLVAIGPSPTPREVALSGDKALRYEGGVVKLVAGGSVVAEVDVSVAPKRASWTFYELAGEVVVVESIRTPDGENGRLWTLKTPGAVLETCPSCPESWAVLAPLMGKLCDGAFGEAELARLKDHVAAGRLDKEEVARLWNTVGAMTGFVFKKYPQWNAIFRGDDRDALPESCRPWLAKAHTESELPQAIKTGRDKIRAYWKTL